MTSVLYDLPGPRGRRRNLLATVVGSTLLLGAVGLIVVQLASQGMLDAERWEIFADPEVWGALFRGLWATLRVAIFAAIGACLLGALMTGLRLSRNRLVRGFARVYVELFRGLPVLLLMFFPIVLIDSLTPFLGAIIGLTLYNSAIIAEILRSGVSTLPGGQREAGLAIGLTPTATLRMIELPQAIRIMLPTLISQLVVLLKDTSLAYIITYPELLRTIIQLRDFFGNDFLFPLFVVGAGMYIVVNFGFSMLANALSRRGSRKAAKAGAA